MQVLHEDGRKEQFDNLTPKTASELVEEILVTDETVTEIIITPNRHDRRRQAALDRKRDKERERQ